MIRKLPLLIFSILLLFSCKGALWNGDKSDELTISINNPFYQGSTASPQSSRAFAIQGEYLYIELALINDQAAYDADTGKAMTGNGTWIETSWGGHAIVTYSFTTTISIFEPLFVDVPRGQNIKARVFLDASEASLIDGLNGFYWSETLPMCHTYNPAGADNQEKSWVTILANDLDTNSISISIRPDVIESVTNGWSTFLSLNEDYNSTAANLNQPVLNETQFYYINPAIDTLYVRDLAYFSLVYGSVLTETSSPTSISLLYDNDGTPFDTGSATYTENGNYDYRLLQIHNAALSDYISPEYFLGTSLLSSPSSSWDLSFGVLYDNSITVENWSSDLHIYDVTVPYGFEDGEGLDFSVINISSVDVSLQDIDTVDKVRSYPPLFDSNWDTTGFSWDATSLSYDTDAHSPDGNSWIIVLARTAGATPGEPFIFAREQVLEVEGEPEE